jgi:RimJ/RimL family protein N-acetyltransferase
MGSRPEVVAAVADRPGVGEFLAGQLLVRAVNGLDRRNGGHYGAGMDHAYPPLNIEVATPRLTLAAATDDLLERLVPIVRAGVVGEGEVPFDDPISLYHESPQREWTWLQRIWAGRSRVSPQFWRLYFVVLADGKPVGMQDLVGKEFAALGTVTTFSWLCPSARHRGLGKEMRAAILHLAFAGLPAREATSEAFTDNHASNGVSRALGYEPNGTAWATRRGDAAQLSGWKLTRERWSSRRRDDIQLTGVEACLPVLGIELP